MKTVLCRVFVVCSGCVQAQEQRIERLVEECRRLEQANFELRYHLLTAQQSVDEPFMSQPRYGDAF
jgi:hypothetical protein